MTSNLSLARYLWSYGAALLVMGLLDGVWLGFVAKGFYSQHMAGHQADSIRILPALLFYIGYPAGLVALALVPAPESMAAGALKAALVGLVAYCVYDLTNLATLRDWSTKLALVDLAWGTFASAVAGAAAYAVLRRG